ncbi:transcriptional regulator, partial [Escherichia coli]|nr:transcriptional regulator [Escherichia coli]
MNLAKMGRARKMMICPLCGSA